MEPNQPTDQKTIDGLHQRAAASYLKGDYNEALQVWRKLLATNAEDERAIEGVRMCELLADATVQVDSEALENLRGPAAASPQTALTDTQRVAESSNDAIGELDASLNRLEPGFELSGLDESASPHAFNVDLPGEEPSSFIEPTAQDFGVSELLDAASPLEAGGRLDATGEFDAIGELDGGAAPQAAAGSAIPAGFETTASQAADVSAAAAERAAEAELRRRSHELMIEARKAYDAGDHDHAESLAKRVLILDETNRDALELQAALRGEEAPAEEEALPSWEGETGFEPTSQATASPAETTAINADELNDLIGDPLEEDLLGDLDFGADTDASESTLAPGDEGFDPQARGIGHEDELPDDVGSIGLAGEAGAGASSGQPVETPPEVKPESSTSESSAEDSPDEFVDDEFAEEEESEHAALDRASARLAQLQAEQAKVVSARRLGALITAALIGLLVLGAGIWGAMSFFGGDSTDASDGSQLASVMPPSGKKQKAKKQKVTPVVETIAPETLDAWLETANKAASAGAYATAVEYYDRILEKRPSDAAAKAGLDHAVAAIQAENALNKKEQEAFAAFQRGDYRSALRAFYRLPEETGRDYSKQIANGWFNLGLVALQSGNCSAAEEGIAEYVELVGAKGDARTASILAQRCSRSVSEREFQQVLSTLNIKGLED